MIALELLHGLTGRLLWVGLLHSLWIGLLASALTAWVLQTCTRLSHQSRHAVILTALVLIALGIPFVVAVEYLAAPRHSGGTPAGATDATFDVPGHSVSAAQIERSAYETDRWKDQPAGIDFLRYMRVSLSVMADLANVVQPFALALWSLVVSGLGAVLTMGLIGQTRLRRDASQPQEVVAMRAGRLGRLLRLRNVPPVLVHASLAEPCLCGVFRPVILLPRCWLATVHHELVDAVLAHELAHARRRDHLVNLGQRVLEILLFFHPGVHWLSHSLRLQRELCTDALAVRLTGDPLALAMALESVARLRLARTFPIPLGAGLTLRGGRATLLPRIQELIGMTPTRPRFLAWPFVAFVSAVVLALATLAIGFIPPAPEERLVFTVASTPLTGEVDEARQIAYEVRFIDTEPDTWRDALQGMIKPLPDSGSVRQWLVDKRSLDQLDQSLIGRPTSRTTFAPKPTGFETQRVMITGNASLDGQIGHNTTIWLGGTMLDASILMTVELTESIHTAPVQRPRVFEEKIRMRLKDSYSIPQDSSLVLSLGRSMKSPGGRHVPSERLIVIRPIGIILEGEEFRVR